VFGSATAFARELIKVPNRSSLIWWETSAGNPLESETAL